MINPIQSAYGISSTLQSKNRNENVDQTKQQNGVRDVVNLSDQDEILSSFFRSQNIPYTPGKPVSLDDLKIGLDISTKQFNTEITRVFSQKNIATDPPVELTSNSKGEIIVIGEHPQKQQIEQLFRDQPELGNAFRGVSALSSLVKAAEKSLEFQKEYQINPKAAVAKYSELFSNNSNEDFSMTFG